MKTCHEFTCIFSPFLGPFFLPHVSNPWNEKGGKCFFKSLEPALKQQPRQLFCGNRFVILGAEEPEDQYWLLKSLFYVPSNLLHASLPTTHLLLLPSLFVSWLFLVGGRSKSMAPQYMGSPVEQNYTEFSSLEPSAEALSPAPQKSWPNSSSFAQDFPSISTESPTTLSKPTWLVTLMWTNFCTGTVALLTLAFYLPEIYLKFCLKQNLFFFVFCFSERSKNY